MKFARADVENQNACVVTVYHKQAIAILIESHAARKIEAVVIRYPALAGGRTSPFAFLATECASTMRRRCGGFAVKVRLADHRNRRCSVLEVSFADVIYQYPIVAAVGQEKPLSLFINIHRKRRAAAAADAAVGTEDLKIDPRRAST